MKSQESRQCPICGKTYYKNVSTKRWNSSHGKYCSRECFNKTLTGKVFYRPPRVKWPIEDQVLGNGTIIQWPKIIIVGDHYQVPVVCGICNNIRKIFAHHTKRGDFTGLCQSCSSIAPKNVGEKHPCWSGGHFMDTRGYPAINIRALSGRELEIASQMAKIAHGKPAVIHEHRLVMAIHLDRPLRKDEVVHHKNGNKFDNRLENLEITTHADHRRLDVKYYNLWQESLSEIEKLKLELEKFRKGRK